MRCFVSITLIITTLVAFNAQAAGVSVELSSSEFGCCVNDGSDTSVGRSIFNGTTGNLTVSTSANVTTGILRGEAYSSAYVESGGTSPTMDSGMGNATANIRLTNLDPTNPYVIGPGELGLDFDANHSRNQQNAAFGTSQFQMRLSGIVRNEIGELQSLNRAWINHRVSFDEMSVSDNVPDTIRPGITEELGGGTVDYTATVDQIFGTLKLSGIMLNPGWTLDLDLLLAVSAEAGEKEMTPNDVDLFPSAGVDASSTAQLFFNNRGLATDTLEPIEWPTESAVIPLPAAAWFLISALGVLGIFSRKKNSGLESNARY